MPDVPQGGDIALTVNALRFAGWKTVRATGSIESLCGEFEFTCGIGTLDRSELAAIQPWAECRIDWLPGEGRPADTVMTGFIDMRGRRHAKNERLFRVAGRDRTADAVDCSAVHKGGTFTRQTFLQIATALCGPLGIEVKDLAGELTAKPFAQFTIQQGETVFEALSRLAAVRGVLLVSDSKGALLITLPGTERIGRPLVYGENILEGNVDENLRDRFSEVTVKGQSAGSNDSWAEQVSGGKGVATDASVPRYRPVVVTAAEPGDRADFRKQAEWEVHRRWGRSVRCNLVSPGWLNPDGGLWKPNQLVTVIDPVLDVSDELLITTVTLSRSAEDGTKAELTVMPREAFDVLVRRKKAKKEGWWPTLEIN